jgi:hypothetical protein
MALVIGAYASADCTLLYLKETGDAKADMTGSACTTRGIEINSIR